MSTPTETSDMISILTQDHREVEQLFGELESPRTDADRRQQVLSVTIAELIRHSVAEEQHLYPATREVLPDGDEIADREIADHQAVEATLKRLEQLRPGDPGFEADVQSLISSVREHVADEEGSLFPRLREACSPRQLDDLGAKIDEAKQTAPTRPRPSAPDMPPANKLLDPGAGMVDRLRDALSKRPTSPQDIE